jgi:hypothetical protein
MIIWLLIAFVVINVICGLVLKKFGQKQWTPFLTEGTPIEKINRVMPEETPQSIQSILSSFSSSPVSTGGAFRMTYAPYVEHKDVAFQSQYLNVTPDGIRLNHRSDHKDPFKKDKNLFNIFLFGGSTTLGYGVKDSDTIAAYLEKACRTHRGGVQIFNCGRQSYFSTSELLAFQRFLQHGAHIKQVIFIDGLNDVFHNSPVFRNRSRFSEHFEKNWPYLAGALSQDQALSLGAWLNEIWVYFWRRLPMVAFFNKTTERMGRELAKRENKENNSRLTEPWVKKMDLDRFDAMTLAERIAQLTNINWDTIRGICQSFDIQPLFVLQPVYYVMKDLKQHIFLKDEHPFWYDVYRYYYQLMDGTNTSREDFLSLAGLLDSAQQCPFVDSHHYSPYGNGLIAKEIVQKIRNDLDFKVEAGA